MARRDLADGRVMRLGLSSAAAPDATLHELFAACGRRGLGALELRAGDAHGVSPAYGRLGGVSAVELADASGIRISAYRAAPDGAASTLARLGRALGAPVLLQGGAIEERLARAERVAAGGAAVAVVVSGVTALRDAARAAARGLAIGWDAEPGRAPLGPDAEALLARFRDRLHHVRIQGGGPEAALHEGRGLGELMARLALAGYAGSVILSPASPAYRLAWQAWLGRRGGWGCGSKAADDSLVRLTPRAAATVGGAA